MYQIIDKVTCQSTKYVRAGNHTTVHGVHHTSIGLYNSMPPPVNLAYYKIS